MDNVKHCLVLAPHYDDAELGCGATMAKLARNNVVVSVMVFTKQRNVSPGNLEDEMGLAQKVLGYDIAEPSSRFNARNLSSQRQEVLDTMMSIGEFLKPDLVIAPSFTHTHQDHVVVSEEAFRAFKHTSLLGYDMPWNDLDSGRLTTFVEVSEHDLGLKAKASSCYKSQMPRPYFGEDVIFSLARARGLQCGKPYAEAFETYRWLI